METDDQLRARIRYVAGDIRDLAHSGEKLDEVAWRFDLKRRKIDRETTQPIKRAPMFPDYNPIKESW